MAWNVKKTIVLVGMMGAGKSAVGKALAARLGVGFLDSDAEIERAAAMTIPEIFERFLLLKMLSRLEHICLGNRRYVSSLL